MKIAVVNDIHVGRALTHNGLIRASSHLIKDKLEGILQHIIHLHSPDLVVNLGDLIRSDNKENDLKAYSELLSHFKALQTPVIHLLGNHEVKRMAEKDLETIWREQDFNQNSFGSKKFGEFHIVWLGLALDPEDHTICFLPNEQLAWLEKELSLGLPTLIFSHCPLDDHDTTGNFFYEAMDNRSKKALFLHNQEAARNIIASSSNVIAVFQAHLHYSNVKLIHQIPYITCPAMGDNICAPNIQDNIPEIYTIITVDDKHLTVKAFSGDYCFTGFETQK